MIATVPCSSCGSPLKRSFVRIEKSRNFFCNPRCKGDWQIGKYTVDNENYSNKYRLLKRFGVAIKEHRLVVQKSTGHHLDKKTHVHHINENTLDNRFENLIQMTAAEHNAHHKTNHIDVNCAISMREGGATLELIAKEFNVSRTTVGRRMRESGVSTKRKTSLTWNFNEALILIKKGFSRRKVAITLGISESALKKTFKKRGVNCEDARNKNSYNIDEIKLMFFSGKSTDAIAESAGVSYGAIWKLLKRLGLKRT